jgi:BNR repeat-like domain
VNTVRRRAIPANTVPALSLALLATFFIVGGHRQPPPASAQGGSIPLRGGVAVQPPQDYEAGARLLKAPSGRLFRVWTRWADESGGTILLASSTDGLAWQPVTQVQPDDAGVSHQEGQVVVNEAGDIALAYRWVRSSPKIKHIRLAHSTDAGKTWTTPTDNLDSSAAPFAPQVAWGSGRALVVAWLDEGSEGSRRFDIYVRRSPDGGNTWEPEVNMTGDRHDGNSYTPRLVGDGKGQFWLVWIDSRGGAARLRLTRSEDNGRTWSPGVPVSGNSRSALGHSLEASSNNRLLLTWQGQMGSRFDEPVRIYAISSNDGGATWSSPVEADGLPPGGQTNAVGPSSALTAAGEAWVAWHDNRNGRNDVFVARSADGGLRWDLPQRLDADSPGTAESRFPRLAVSPDGTTVAVVWEDDRSGLEAVYGRILSGGQWSAEIRLGPTLPPKTAARAPLIASTGNDAFYVMWGLWDYSRGTSRPARSLNSAVVRVRTSAGS